MKVIKENGWRLGESESDTDVKAVGLEFYKDAYKLL